MKQLVYWCRWHRARLRIRGRDKEAIWGELAFEDKTERFRFVLATGQLIIESAEGSRTVQLDEMGVEI